MPHGVSEFIEPGQAACAIAAGIVGTLSGCCILPADGNIVRVTRRPMAPLQARIDPRSGRRVLHVRRTFAPDGD